MSTLKDKPIAAHQIEALAREGVARALAARGEIAELAVEQLDAVSGGAAIAKGSEPIRSGAVRTRLILQF